MRINRERFAVALIRAEMSVNQLAELANVSRATVSSVKCGKSCSEKTGEKLAQVLGAEISER